MFASLPPLALHDAHSLWYPSLSAHSHPTPSSTSANGTHHHANNPQQNRNAHPATPLRTILTTLRNDENALALRKANIRRFGAGWLKPPGVSKTLQGMRDEEVEKEEQEAVAAREMALLEAQAAAEEAEGLDDPNEAGASERDLDDEIPDAEQEEHPDLDDGQEAWEDEDGDDALPTEEGDGDYAGEEGEGDTEGRDLDDEVPEGGSYQHTDTDVEDESSEDGNHSGGARESLPAGVARSGGLASSVFGSSPAVQPRATVRRNGGLQGRGQGREN